MEQLDGVKWSRRSRSTFAVREILLVSIDALQTPLRRYKLTLSSSYGQSVSIYMPSARCAV